MKKPIDLVQEVQLRLAAVRCPSCEHGRLDLQIRCDVSSSECLYLVTCLACRADYWVDLDSLPDDETEDQIVFSCDAVTHRCAYGIARAA